MGSWDEACEVCELPTLVNTGSKRCGKIPASELDAAWNGFRMIMEPVRNWYRENKEKMQMDSNFTQELKAHEQKDHDWECDICEKQYTSIEELKEHEDDYHEQKCDRCKKQYVHIKELGEHLMKVHGIRIYRCTECGKEFESLEELGEHVKNCYTCDLCNYGVGMNRRDFEDHIEWKHFKDCYTCGQYNNSYENREDVEDHRRRRYTKYNCDQCDKWYESREDLEGHRRRRHTKYNCDQCEDWYESRGDLEDHRKRRHTKECDKKLVCRNKREQQKKEEHRGGLTCNLCEENFKNKNDLKEHWETDHQGPVYECIHLECENRYLCQEMWREHMKEKHRIGFYCEQCDEYCLFEEELEEHMDSHVTEIEYEEDLEEHTEIECLQCKEKFRQK